MRVFKVITLLIVVAVPALLKAQAMPWVGRWVNVDAADMGMFVIAFSPDGHVHRLIPAPKFQATFRLEAGHIVMRASDGSVDDSMVPHADTIVRNGRAAFVRAADFPGRPPAVLGTWVSVGMPPLEMFMTLRSDSQVVIEVGVQMVASLHADTLRLTSTQVPAAWFTVRQVGDTLHVSDATGRARRFVRRPWGCLGVGTFDMPASECH